MRTKRHRYQHPAPSPRGKRSKTGSLILTVGIIVAAGFTVAVAVIWAAVIAGSPGVAGDWEAYDQSIDLTLTDSGRFSWTNRDIDGEQISLMEGTYRETGGGKYRAKVTRITIDSADKATKGLAKYWVGYEFDIRLQGGELLIAFLKDDTPVRYRRK